MLRSSQVLGPVRTTTVFVFGGQLAIVSSQTEGVRNAEKDLVTAPEQPGAWRA